MVELEMLNLIIMLYEKVSVGFQDFTWRTLARFAGRVRWGRSVCPCLPRPHRSDHVAGPAADSEHQSAEECTHTCTHFRITRTPCTLWSPNITKFHGRNGAQLLEHMLDRRKATLPWSPLNQQSQLSRTWEESLGDLAKNSSAWASIHKNPDPRSVQRFKRSPGKSNMPHACP